MTRTTGEKELLANMDRCTGRCTVTEIMLKTITRSQKFRLVQIETVRRRQF